MTEIAVVAIRIGFLALIWLFILFVINVIRTDMIGNPIPASEVSVGKRDKRSRRNKSKKSAETGPTTLSIVEGRSAGAKIPLFGLIVIGRNFDCTLQIDDDYSSGQHAKLFQGEDGWVVEDLASLNGTYVNEVMITAPTIITEADDIRIGRTHLRLEK